MREIIDRTGEIRRNKEHLGNYEMKIVEYNGCSDIIVEFQDEHKAKVHTSYQHFKKGEVKNPYNKMVYGVGYFGEGKYKSRGEDGKQTKAYIIWKNMLRRCYNERELEKRSTYRDCYVCEEWHNFQNFARWFYKNYYEIENEVMCLDKDILCKGNKIYSPETCVLVPNNINLLFTKSDKIRGEYPIGVYYHKASNNLKVQCSVFENEKKKRIYLGYFPLNKPFQAFYAYKTFKENYIKQVADAYKDLIPKKLYEALYKYEVEIND